MAEIAFEKAMEKLEQIVEQLEEGELALDVSLKKYEEGVKLARICQEHLDKAKAKVELLMKKRSGTFEQKPFESEE